MNLHLEFPIKQSPLISLSSVNLTLNEQSEFLTSIQYNNETNKFYGELGNTWFDITNYYDINMTLQISDKIIPSAYIMNDNGNMNFKLGVYNMKNTSNINLYFKLKFDLLYKNTNHVLTMHNKNSFNFLNDLTLKYFRKQNLHNFWRRKMKLEK